MKEECKHCGLEFSNHLPAHDDALGLCSACEFTYNRRRRELLHGAQIRVMESNDRLVQELEALYNEFHPEEVE